jgi:hypothetical protein
MSAAADGLAPPAPVIRRPLGGPDAVRREFRRSRRAVAPERWSARRLREQLPRVALGEALEILIEWRGQPRFEAGALAWHSRLCGHVPSLTFEDAARALEALRKLGGPCPEPAVYALRALCARHRLGNAAAVLDEWLRQRESQGGF